MIIIPIKDNENIERALKRYKKKNDKIKTLKKLRAKKHYIKPSVINRQRLLKACYSQKIKQNQE